MKGEMSMKKQVLFIQGAGEGAYEADKKLAASLQQSLGPEYEVGCPALPDEENAPYEQWKQHIEKELATMQRSIILIGHSVGASIVMKCMSEIEVKQPIAGIFSDCHPVLGREWLAVRRLRGACAAKRVRHSAPEGRVIISVP
jgi:uncharacterized protein